MKTLTTTILALTLSLVNLFAQNIDYYSGKDRVKGKNCEYIIKEKNEELFKISNANNKITNVKSQVLKSGKTLSTVLELPLIHMIEKGKHVEVFKDVFTKEDINSMLEYKSERLLKAIGISLFVDFNGRLLEMSFDLYRTPEFLSISPDKLYEFEKRLKKEVKFNIPQEYIEEYKKEFNFLQGGYYIIDLKRLDYVFK